MKKIPQIFPPNFPNLLLHTFSILFLHLFLTLLLKLVFPIYFSVGKLNELPLRLARTPFPREPTLISTQDNKLTQIQRNNAIGYHNKQTQDWSLLHPIALYFILCTANVPPYTTVRFAPVSSQRAGKKWCTFGVMVLITIDLLIYCFII